MISQRLAKPLNGTRCVRCVAPVVQSLIDQVEALRAEIQYLRLRCAEEGVFASQAFDPSPAYRTRHYTTC